MVLNIPMIDSHRAYVNAVAAALTAAGVPIIDIDVLDDMWDDGEPIRGALTLIDATRTAAAYPDRQVWAEWDERSGWDLSVFDRAANCIEPKHSLCAEVLPAPADVAAATVAVLAAHPSASTTLQRPVLNRDDWNEALEEGLDAYTRAAQEGTAALRATP
ncbi:DUF6292 family protein [Streptomyces sp. NPDC056831]|uniref:DUF6292 family protein n=1 Tax=Streptomyces sp. NPDC056831 TaxID=3345954 RepID=UPI003684B94E